MQKAHRRRPDFQGGFSTIELTVSVALIGITLAVGVQRIDSTVWRLDASARDVSQRLRAARAMAVLKQHDVIVTFDSDGGRLILHIDPNNDGIVDAEERVTSFYLEKGISFSLGTAPAYDDFIEGPIAFEGDKVMFRRNGAASQEGAVYLAGPTGEKVRAVVLSRATGYTETFRYGAEGWRSDD